ncbi:MAG: magnesium transporter [Clostridia bacterium]
METDITKEDITEKITSYLNERNFSDLKSIISEMNPADLAIIMTELPEKKVAIFFRLLPKDLAAETFVEIDTDMQEDLIRSLSDAELREVFDELYIDDTVDILEEMPASVVKRILENTDKETRHVINELLKYPEDSAGSIMTTEYVRLNASMTVSDALAVIRRSGVEKETIYTCYVTDNNRVLKGIVTAKMLLISSADKVIEEIMETNVITAKTTEDKEDVANVFKKYDFIALPVVDDENRLVGIVTIDDAVDVLQEEATEDIEKMAAITPTEKPYLKMSAWGLYLSRIPWLLILMVSATFTGMIITGFENALAAQVVLTAYIPMLMDTGGNCGSQASVTVIRGLSLDEIRFKDIFRVQWKEFRVSLLCGLTLAVANFFKLMLFDRLSITVAAVVCLTILVTVVIAKFVGCSLPMLAKKIGFDPAVMASPFITTIVDAISLIVYFRIATFLLNL